MLYIYKNSFFAIFCVAIAEINLRSKMKKSNIITGVE